MLCIITARPVKNRTGTMATREYVSLLKKKRRPSRGKSNVSMAADKQAGENDESCPICLELLSDATLCTLPCEHDFHRDCVEALRKLGVLKACPLCRADLPNGPEKLLEEEIRI